jgi:hypothetical protein
MVPDRFAEFLNQNGVLVGVVICLLTGRTEIVGDRNALESDDILSQYFRDVSVLVKSLEGRILPRAVQQGNVMCIISRPNPATVIALLYNDEGDAIARYRRCVDLDARLLLLWSNPSHREMGR